MLEMKLRYTCLLYVSPVQERKKNMTNSTTHVDFGTIEAILISYPKKRIFKKALVHLLHLQIKNKPVNPVCSFLRTTLSKFNIFMVGFI